MAKTYKELEGVEDLRELRINMRVRVTMKAPEGEEPEVREGVITPASRSTELVLQLSDAADDIVTRRIADMAKIEIVTDDDEEETRREDEGTRRPEGEGPETAKRPSWFKRAWARLKEKFSKKSKPATPATGTPETEVEDVPSIPSPFRARMNAVGGWFQRNWRTIVLVILILALIVAAGFVVREIYKSWTSQPTAVEETQGTVPANTSTHRPQTTPVPSAPAANTITVDAKKWITDCVQLGGTPKGCQDRLTWLQGK